MGLNSLYVFRLGVLNSSGSTWEAQRKFTVKTLRKLGFAKASMESVILGEVQSMLDWFRKKEGSPISGVRIFNAPVINSIFRIVTGERYNWEDSPPKILDAFETFFRYKSINVFYIYYRLATFKSQEKERLF